MSHIASQEVSDERQFSLRMHPSRPGARLARELAAWWLGRRGLPRPAAEAAVQIVAELAANAALHGRVPGRDALLELRLADGGRVLRVEVTDTRGDRIPPARPQPPAGDAESGRGLLIVDGLACRWGVTTGPPPRKTVWAELDLAPEPGEPCSGGLASPSKERTEGKDPSKPHPSPRSGRPHPLG
ncbi:hypothetical protein BJP40_30540 [Streptomyces sp. CC53]|uniref:ATP-binding protein n=2 Tax=unclassified Streptomyces TaxID=2593676 RepID=UPI0008DD30E4|nr:ATP-binding protein [Streptomyces sp. CC53]OII61755.1 hypothetical protein BJP40_30540 [Streptomyces sp. CC53]